MATKQVPDRKQHRLITKEELQRQLFGNPLFPVVQGRSYVAEFLMALAKEAGNPTAAVRLFDKLLPAMRPFAAKMAQLERQHQEQYGSNPRSFVRNEASPQTLATLISSNKRLHLPGETVRLIPSTIVLIEYERQCILSAASLGKLEGSGSTRGSIVKKFPSIQRLQLQKSIESTEKLHQMIRDHYDEILLFDVMLPFQEFLTACKKNGRCHEINWGGITGDRPKNVPDWYTHYGYVIEGPEKDALSMLPRDLQDRVTTWPMDGPYDMFECEWPEQLNPYFIGFFAEKYLPNWQTNGRGFPSKSCKYGYGAAYMHRQIVDQHVFGWHAAGTENTDDSEEEHFTLSFAR